MNLQNRILLTYGYLIVLVVLGAVSAALGFRDLGASIDNVLGENFESVRASTSMLESLERQDSAMLAMLLGESTARADLDHAQETFLRSLDRARANVTIRGEAELLAELEQEFDAYRGSRDALLAEAPERPLQAYELSTSPAFGRVKDRILELVDLNHEAMQRADAEAQRSATTRAALHGLLVAVAVLSLAPLIRTIRRDVLSRIHELADVASAIAAGDRRRRVSVDQNDELGLVARQLNAVLDQLQHAETEAAGEMDRDRRLLRALLEELGAPAALATRDGRLLAATLDPELIPDLAEALESRARSGPFERGTLSAAGRRLDLRPLRTGGDRLIGWLALRVEDSVGA